MIIIRANFIKLFRLMNRLKRAGYSRTVAHF